LLRIRLAQVDSEAEYVDRLWTRKPNVQLRATVGDALCLGLDHVDELGRLRAQPGLLAHLF
jgi:hypothetical protein